MFSQTLVKRYQDILKADPGSTAFCPLAQVYRMRKELSRAEKLCLEGLKHNPHHQAGYIALAQTYKDRGDGKSALKYLNKAKELNPENPTIYGLLGEVYRDRGDMESSLAAFRMLLFFKPWSAFASQMVQQMENAAPGQEAANGNDISFQKNSKEEGLGRAVKEEKLRKLQRLLARMEKALLIAEHS